MNAKEYLSQVMYIDQRINSKLEQVTRLRENVTNCTATLSDMPRPESGGAKGDQRSERSCSAADFGVAVSVLQAVAGDHGGAGAQ